ncbi:MAG: F0F1 ATP synthase subunit A [Candidatus Adiutrix sp.]|jgi:F-type H+-transporting ATPase subunit a|nr:F0F1 ATP synthase subunit A [Candidatus Adiutrix sp.]
MEHPIMFLAILADLFGESAGGFVHHYPHLAYAWMIMIVLIVLSKLATAKITLVPSGLQNFFEYVIESLENFQVSIMGEGGRRFFPLVGTIFIFVLCCNFQGLIPGSFSPTANLNTTASLAALIFLTTHIVGISKHGFRYVKHFMGPMLVLAPLMFVIEVISHLSRLISLSLRLFGNVMGEDLVLIILFAMGGAYFLPLPMMFLGLLTGFLQAFIMTLLAMIYVSDALHEAH